MRLNGNMALVTGAAVTIADLNLQGARGAAEATKAKGGNAVTVAMDVVDEAQVERP